MISSRPRWDFFDFSWQLYFSLKGNSGVSSGVVYIESGQKVEWSKKRNILILSISQIDQKAVFDRKDCSIFGWSLDKTDLQYVLELNEPCFVKLEPLPECELDCEVIHFSVSVELIIFFPCRFKPEWSVYGLVGPKNMLPTTTHQRCESNFVLGENISNASHTTAGSSWRPAQAASLLGGAQSLYRRLPQCGQGREDPKVGLVAISNQLYVTRAEKNLSFAGSSFRSGRMRWKGRWCNWIEAPNLEVGGDCKI